MFKGLKQVSLARNTWPHVYGKVRIAGTMCLFLGGALREMTGNNSSDSVRIDVALVDHLVAEQFPQFADLPIKPVELSGWDNRTFHLGDAMSVRLPSAARYKAQVENEWRWLPKIAPHLPLPIPIPLALGQPSDAYPWHWSINQWLDGESAALERIGDLNQFASDLAEFLAALQGVDADGAPKPGKDNFYRGGALSIYDNETRDAIGALEDEVDSAVATAIWESALAASWHEPPVWIHGDVAAGNLLVHRGRLCAVIDFGQLAVGDPACDMAIAWTLLTSASREVLQRALSVDEATWARGRGWALWKAMIIRARQVGTNAVETEIARRVIDELFEDYENRVR